MPVKIIENSAEHRRRALELARGLGWATTYDAEYVVIARDLGCPLLTTDDRLSRGAAHLVAMLDPRTFPGVERSQHPTISALPQHYFR